MANQKVDSNWNSRKLSIKHKALWAALALFGIESLHMPIEEVMC